MITNFNAMKTLKTNSSLCDHAVLGDKIQVSIKIKIYFRS